MTPVVTNNYNPDVLNCIANLSSDEVFTPPTLANRILDLLPAELWSDEKATFLDPGCKSGVFLREIAKRMIAGIEKKIPDLQKRLDHIYTKQIFGIAITELTALLSRRSLYCSKKADGKYSICTGFDDEKGNIVFKKVKHKWKDGRCSFCGASRQEYDRDEQLETHAYQFIHTEKPEEILNMKFDVIVGNPPYQLSDSGAKASASPLYHLFVEQAMKLNPRFLTMIIPSRWFSGGKGLDEFRNKMFHDTRIRRLFDFPNSMDVFPGVDLSGGVCYFLWDRDNRGDCEITTTIEGKTSTCSRPLIDKSVGCFIRYNEAVSIVRKVATQKEPSFSSFVSSRKPFGLPTNFDKIKDQEFTDSVKIFTYKKNGYVKRSEIKQNREWIDKYKVFISRAYGERISSSYWVLGKSFIGGPGTCCNETYLVIGPYKTKLICNNVCSYIQTRFFRFLVLLNKPTQDATSKVYSLVPIQDFSESWSDDKLYKKYKLSKEEIAFIESMVRPMGDDNG